jgi:chemotaxis protein CheD
VLDAFRKPQGSHLGDHNVGRALETLAEEGIPVVARDTGGERARKLVFHTDTGAAWLRAI